jgi:hypothetical protein
MRASATGRLIQSIGEGGQGGPRPSGGISLNPSPADRLLANYARLELSLHAAQYAAARTSSPATYDSSDVLDDRPEAKEPRASGTIPLVRV